MVTERRPTYWGWRVELETHQARWRRIAAGLAVGILGLVGLLVHQSLRPRPIYYVTATHGIAEAGHVPDAVVEGFVARVVARLGNLTPATASAGYEQSRRYRAPRVADLLGAQGRRPGRTSPGPSTALRPVTTLPVNERREPGAALVGSPGAYYQAEGRLDDVFTPSEESGAGVEKMQATRQVCRERLRYSTRGNRGNPSCLRITTHITSESS